MNKPSQDGLPELPAPHAAYQKTAHLYSTCLTHGFSMQMSSDGSSHCNSCGQNWLPTKVLYTADETRAYGAQCRAAALEQAAQIVEREAMPSERPRFGVAADAIRALAAAPKGEV